MQTQTFGKILVRVRDAQTGAIVQTVGPVHNLVYDAGLNALANNAGFPGIFRVCAVGSSNHPTSIASAAVTFTQTGTAITASAGFFTTEMTGALLKYGASGPSGLEVYLTVINSTTATASVSATVTALPGTVYLVNQAGLFAGLYTTSTYDTSSGANGTTFAGAAAVMQRTFKFPIQSVNYSVNEIGYAYDATYNTFGRVVLPVTVSVSTTQYLEVQIVMTFTVAPASPTATPNVSAGTFDTAGTSMCESWSCQAVASNGNTYSQSQGFMDGAPNGLLIPVYLAADISYVQQTSISASPPTPPNNTIFLGNLGNMSNAGNPVGVGTSGISWSISTSGQVPNIIWCTTQAGNYNVFSLLLTSGQVLPTGSFNGTLAFSWTFARQLSN